jgi:DNA invertase Pin-like site-specific DNA recombinase
MSTRKSRHLAVSYSRFSDPQQSQGDSEGRQQEMFKKFCEHHNLTPLTEVYADRGRSGYKDEHRKKGRLGELIAAAKDGRFEPGTVIVVEAWDRLGRLRPDKQTDLVAELLRTGVKIGICQLDDTFCEDDFGTHKWTTLAVFIQLAFQESKQKSERLKSAWVKARKRAREEKRLLPRLPAWVERGPDDKPRLIPERAAVVKRIFALAIEGLGHRAIVRTLEAEGVPPFGQRKVNKGRSRSQFCGRWSAPYVALILRDRRAVGELQLRLADESPDGAPLAGFFPAAVDEPTFALARQALDGRMPTVRRRHRKYVNTFAGLLVHARDGEGMMLHCFTYKGKPHVTLWNSSNRGGRGPGYSWPYHDFERLVLGAMREIDARDVLPQEKPARRADELRARLAYVRGEIAQLGRELEEGFSKGVAAALKKREAEEVELGDQLQQELAESVAPAARAWEALPSLVDLLETSADPDAQRMRIRAALQRGVETMPVLLVRNGAWRLLALQVFFTSGAVRSYMLGYLPEAYCRPRQLLCRSLADMAPGTVGIDLRVADDVTALEVVLRNLDADALS